MDINLLDLDTIFDNDCGTVPSRPDMTPEDLTARWEEVYRELVSVHERSGRLPREQAEYYALLDTLELIQARDQYPFGKIGKLIDTRSLGVRRVEFYP